MKLNELIVEDEWKDYTAGVTKVASDIKAGYNKVKDIVNAERTSRKEAVSKMKSQETAKMRVLVKDVLTRFFETFPDYPGEPDVQSIIENIKTKKLARVAAVIFRDLAKDLEKVQNGVNSAAAKLVPGGKKTVDDYKAKADASMTREPNAETIKFARSEAPFFKRLVMLDDDFSLDSPNFSSLLNAKMKLTAPEKKAQAVRELNQLLSYMRGAIYAYAKDIADKAVELPDEENEE